MSKESLKESISSSIGGSHSKEAIENSNTEENTLNSTYTKDSSEISEAIKQIDNVIEDFTNENEFSLDDIPNVPTSGQGDKSWSRSDTPYPRSSSSSMSSLTSHSNDVNRPWLVTSAVPRNPRYVEPVTNQNELWKTPVKKSEDWIK